MQGLILFSFLRGRLRTMASVEKILIDEKVFSFLRGRLRTRTLPSSSGGGSCFHSFEVGFGPRVGQLRRAQTIQVFIPSR